MNKISVKESSLAFLFGSLLCQVAVGVFLVFAGFFSTIFGFEISLNSLRGNCWTYLICVVFMNMALFAVFWFYKKKHQVEVIKKPAGTKILIYVLVAILAFLCLSPAINLFNLGLEKLNIPQSKIPYNFNLQGFLISIMSLALIPAVFEELLFRGVIFSGLKNISKTFAIIISALMFSIFHLSINQTIYPFVMGLLLGGIMWEENNILYTIIVHFVSNLLTLIFTYFNLWFISTHWAFIILAIILFIAVLTLLLINTFYKNKKQNSLTSHEKFYLFLCLGIMLLLWIIINITKIL